MTRRYRHDPPADRITTIGQMMSEAPRWFHVTCNTIGCRNRAAVPLVPLILRWGPHAPREWLDTRFRCTRCGAEGHEGLTRYDNKKAPPARSRRGQVDRQKPIQGRKRGRHNPACQRDLTATESSDRKQ